MLVSCTSLIYSHAEPVMEDLGPDSDMDEDFHTIPTGIVVSDDDMLQDERQDSETNVS
jgi:hypothetical protein